MILVEAKAHIDELLSSGTQAGPASRERIDTALLEVQNYLKAKPDLDWTGPLYQYANRVAHLYFLRAVNDVPAYLVNCYFMGDTEMSSPTSESEWRGALQVAERLLGLRRHRLKRYMIDVFIDVTDLH